MNDRTILRTALITFLVAALPACKNEREAQIESFVLQDLPAPARQNNLSGLSGAVYSHAANSPIHWQPCTSQSFQIAKDTNRMVFAMVAMSQAAGFTETLDALASDPGMVDLINTNYLPIIIDADDFREFALLIADLSIEIKQNINLPFFIWMSPEANPVAWIASPWLNTNNTREHFMRSHSMVAKIWEESPEYVIRNSAMDNETRHARISKRRLNRIESEQPQVDTVRAIRQLTSLYDPLSRNYDEIGALFPVGTLDLLASAAMQPTLPSDVKRRANETTREFVKDLLGSAIFDPLDGGLFSGRRGNSWSLPQYNRNSVMQSRAAVALFRTYQATGMDIALERALGVLKFVENNYQTNDGLFTMANFEPIDTHLWLWNIEEVQEILGPDDGKWFASLTDMRERGNIAYENDPERQFFRLNSLALAKATAELAADSEMSPDAFTSRFDSACEKLLAAREKRFGKWIRGEHAHAVASFRMVSAYAAAFTATGDNAWRLKAVELLNHSRNAFSDGSLLRAYPAAEHLANIEARAFVYAVAIQSILDIVDITSDHSWLDWGDNLATIMTENFARDGFLREATEKSSVINLPMTDLIMLFEDSTIGLLNFAECRLAARNRPLMRELRELAGVLPVSAVDYPVQHTDIVQSFLARHYSFTVIHNQKTSPDLISHIERLPIRMFHRRLANDGDNLPPGGCLLLRPDSPDPILISNPAELENALLPSGESM